MENEILEQPIFLIKWQTNDVPQAFSVQWGPDEIVIYHVMIDDLAFIEHKQAAIVANGIANKIGAKLTFEVRDYSEWKEENEWEEEEPERGEPNPDKMPLSFRNRELGLGKYK